MDKNGVEIYEGDIIVGTYKNMGTDTGLVVFKGCGFKVEIPNVGDDELEDRVATVYTNLNQDRSHKNSEERIAELEELVKKLALELASR